MILARVVALSAVFVATSWADQITMKNGDRFSGSVIKIDGKNLVFKSEYAGVVAVPWEAVTSISSTAPLNFTLKDGQLVVGTVTSSGTQLTVQTKSAGAVSASKDDVTMVRSEAEQAEADRYKNPRLTDLWGGFVDLGYAAARGNSVTNNLNVSANAARITSRDKIAVYFTSLYADTSVSGKSVATANSERGGISYNLNLRPRLFVFGATDLESDQFQDLDLRFSPSGGFGYHAAKNAKTTFDIFGGGSLDREFFSDGLKRTSGEMILGEELNYKLSSITTIHEKLSFYPNLSMGGDYRSNFDLAAATTLRKWLAWQVTISDRYLSDPLAGFKKNDLIFTTGVRVTFTQGGPK